MNPAQSGSKMREDIDIWKILNNHDSLGRRDRMISWPQKQTCNFEATTKSSTVELPGNIEFIV